MHPEHKFYPEPGSKGIGRKVCQASPRKHRRVVRMNAGYQNKPNWTKIQPSDFPKKQGSQILSSSLQSYLRASSLFHFLYLAKRDTNTNTAALLGELHTACVGCWAQRLEGKSRPKWWLFLFLLRWPGGQTSPSREVRLPGGMKSKTGRHTGGAEASRKACCQILFHSPWCHTAPREIFR